MNFAKVGEAHCFYPRMKKLSDKEIASNLDFFGRHNTPEDPNFSERRNRDVIARTIKKNDALRKKKLKEYWDGKGSKIGLNERINMTASFMKAKDMGGKGATNINRYLGKRIAAKLRAEQIVNRLKDTLKVVN